MGRNLKFRLLIFFIIFPSPRHLLKFSSPRVFLPYIPGASTNFTLELQDYKTNDCFEWASTSKVDVHPIYSKNGNCAMKAIVSLSSLLPHQDAVISVTQMGEAVLFCDVIVDKISSIELEYRNEIFVDGPPEMVSVIAKNDKGSTFSSLEGLQIEWKLENLKEKDLQHSNLIFVSYLQSCYQPVENNLWTLPFANLKGINPGSVLLQASIKHDMYLDISAAKIEIDVSSTEELIPSGIIHVIPKATIPFKITSRYGNIYTKDISAYSFSVENKTVAHMTHEGLLTALNYGKTVVIVKDPKNKVFTTHICVVAPSSISIDLVPSTRSWHLHEATNYHVKINVRDSFQNIIYKSENMKIKVVFPSKFFYINSSTVAGFDHYVRTIVPGSGVIRSELFGIENNESLEKSYNLLTSKEFVIYQGIHVSPPVSLLPFYATDSEMYSIKFKATGGTGVYIWSTSNSVGSKITEINGSTNQVIVDFYAEGDYAITATDTNSSDFHTSSKVSVQHIKDIEVYPTVIEAESGNEIFLPVGMLGFENKQRQIYRVFDDCSKINISVEIIEKYVLSYEPDAFIPSFARGCLSLRFLCHLPGHSRINLSYKSKNDMLKTTVVIACHKPLKPVHPVRVAVLPLGSSKEFAFEGGPRPWPLYHKNYYLKLTADVPKLVNIDILRDPVRYNKDLHVFSVICMELGETVLNLNIGNEASPTNPNPAQSASSVKIVCSTPHSIHVAYKTKTEKKASKLPNKAVVKVPFYGSKQFEIDVWIKDAIGRKLANITSLKIQWKVSDYALAKPLNPNGFLEHIDGSGSFRKVSRNFEQFQMTGKAGTLTVTAELVGYHRDMLKKHGILNYDTLKNISVSIELELVSLRDLYEDTEKNNGHCEGDTCES